MTELVDGDPYRQIGLAANPFIASPEPGEPARTFVDRGLPTPPHHGFVEVVGRKGAGKTTHLLHWLRGRDGGVYRHVPPGVGRFRPLPVAPVVAWDEADRVPAPLLRHAARAARRRGSLVLIGTHRPLGLGDVVHVLADPTAEELSRWARLRVTAVATGEHDHALGDVPAEAIARSCGGDWWQAGTDLHIWAAQQALAGGSHT